MLVAEGPRGLADATAEAIEELFAGRPHERIDSGLIRQWFENLNWGQDKIDAEKAAMLEHSHLGYTTEVSVGWSAGQRPVRHRDGPDPPRVPAGR